MCTRKAPGALILNIFVPGLNPEHRNSSVSLKDTIPAFNMIKDFQDCSLKMQLVHRLIFYPLTQKKLRSCSQRGCSSELLCTARLGEKNQKIKEGTEARLRLTWADLKFLGAPAIMVQVITFWICSATPALCQFPGELVASSRQSISKAPWTGFGCRMWAEGNFYVSKSLWKGFKSLSFFFPRLSYLGDL